VAWYDVFAGFYDHSVEQVYRPYRARAVHALGLTPGAHVLDLACGTGPNFEPLVGAVGETGVVLGVDLSEGMLRRASHRAERAGWTQVRTLQRDARELTHEELERELGSVRLDAVIVSLGLSVIPDWESVARNLYGLLAPGGVFGVFDVHSERRVPMTFLVEWIARADTRRRSWLLFESLGAEVQWDYESGSPHVHGGRPYLVVARKPVDAHLVRNGGGP
jgi:ubiquinone/menaquinone biosynthesis C-methylase UbiE